MSESLSAAPEVKAILISFDFGGQRKLFIMLAADGSINRSGGAEATGVNGGLFIGVTDGKPFQTLAAQVDPEWFRSGGKRFEFAEAQGAPAVMRLILATSAGDYPLEFSYGLESGGLPADMGNFVTEAVRLTDPWYEEQKEMAQNRAKRWWKFW